MRGIITMKSNFFADYHDENRFSISLIYDIISCIWFFSIFFLLFRFAIDAIFFNLESTFGSMVLFSVIASVVLFIVGSIGMGIYLYFDEKDNRYAFFNTADLKKWYALTPKKFVFSSKGDVVYYIHNEGSVAKDSYRENGFEKYYLDTTRMYPKTLFEAFKYRHFVDNLFKAMEKEEKNEAEKLKDIQEQKDIIKGNNEMLRVMGSIQKDIDRVLIESNRVIETETEKMAKLNESI